MKPKTSFTFDYKHKGQSFKCEVKKLYILELNGYRVKFKNKYTGIYHLFPGNGESIEEITIDRKALEKIKKNCLD